MLSRFNLFRQQKGQSIIFVVLFLGVVTLSLVFLYKAGKITSEKMQLQNAADAAAYSVAISEARDLNFMSYTNRAMVANEVAIGQFVGMLSWARHWTSFESYMMAYERLLIYPLIMAVTLGTSGDAVENVFKTATNLVFKVPGDIAQKLFKAVANIGATIMHNINKVYSIGQTGYHYATILFALSAYADLVDDNAPGAHPSEFGILAMLAHVFTYVDVIPQVDSFVQTYSPGSRTKPGDIDGMQRFAAIVNGSKDEWSRKRGWTLGLDIPPLPIDFSTCDDSGQNCRVTILDLGIASLWMEFIFKMSFDFEKTGGSELRNLGTTPCDPPGPEPCAGKGINYNWSAADTTSLLMRLVMKLDVGITVLGADFGAGFDLNTTGGTPQIALELHLPDPPIGDVEIFSIPPPAIPFPTNAPFAAGAAQVGSIPRGMLKDGDMLIENPPNKCKSTTTTGTGGGGGTAPTGGGGGSTTTTANTGGVGASTTTTDPTIDPKTGKKWAKAKNCTPKGTKVVSGDYIALKAYGGSPEHTGAWGQLPKGVLAMPFVGAPGPVWSHYAYMVPTVRSTIGTPQSKLKGYGGLPRYSDTIPQVAPWGFQAPYFLAGVIKNAKDIYSDTAPLTNDECSDYTVDPESDDIDRIENMFHLNDYCIAGKRLGAISKAEVYFSRPLDLAYFGRADDQAEYGSAFNPYWQARLVETTNADRMIALAVQQGQFFSVLGSIQDVLDKIANLPGALLDLF
jgi:hypothetical protein